MRVARLVLSFFVFLSLSPRLNSQQSVTTAQRDPQALSVLQQCVAAGGGAQAFGAIQDFQASGAITYFWAGENVGGSVTAQGKGLTEFRLDSTLPQGTRSFKVVGAAGSFTTENGTTTPLSPYVLMTAANLTLPHLRLNGLLTDSTVALHYVGLVSLGSGQAHEIHVVPQVDPSLVPPNGASQFGSFDVYVDPTTHQIVEVSESFWPSNVNQSLQHEVRYSNYQTAGSVVVPFAISEFVNGQATWSISFSSFSFNNNLSDSIFKP